MILKILFWFSIIIIIYAYIGYFWVLKLLLFFKRYNENNITDIIDDYKYIPVISVIIAAYNEENIIERRIQNLLQQEYSKDKLEIIVASDGSTDKTVEIAKGYEKYGVKVIDFKVNRGRAAVHNDAVKISKGEILVFTDAETEFEKKFLYKITRMFSLSEFGAGAGELIFKSKQDFGEVESGYWKIEKRLRYYEYLLRILPFASGACFCIRKELYQPIPLHSDIDNVLPLKVIKDNYNIFYCKDAIAYEYTVSNDEQLFKKRYRTALRSMTDILSNIPNIVKSRRWGILFVLFSHRLLRWWSSLLLPVLFILNLILYHQNDIYKIIFIVQILFYFLALIGFLYNKYKRHILVKQIKFIKLSTIAYSFIVANMAFIYAILSYIFKKKIVTYKY